MIHKALIIILLNLLLVSTSHGKTLVFPHLAVNSTWSFGLVIVNAGDSDDIVRLEIWDKAGLIETQQITIEAHSRWRMEGYSLSCGVYTIVARSCSDWTFGTLIRFWKDMPVGEEAAQVIPYTPDLQSYDARQNKWWTLIPAKSGFYTKAGKCPYMGKYHWFRLREILREMYLRYQDHEGIDPRPSLGDANDAI